MSALRIGVAGDWHGNRTWALRCVQGFADAGIGEIFHLGDFGIWPGPGGRRYLLDIEAALSAHAMTLFVTPGNHEDYDQINEVSTLDRGRDIGAVQWVSDHVALLPRGHRWKRHGWSFVSLGGAPSIDRWSRRANIDWWAAEAITPADVDRLVAAGPAEVMLAHDAPDAALGTPRVASILRTNPIGWPGYALNYAAQGRARMTTAFLAVEPRLFMHGHFHVKDEAWIEQFDHSTHVVSLDCDGMCEGNLVVVTLPDRSSDAQPVELEEPGVEWLVLAADHPRSGFAEDLVAPKAPIREWSLADVVGVLNNGRSVHWKALARVARRDDSAFGSLLAQALTRTSNDLARDYVHRVLASLDREG